MAGSTRTAPSWRRSPPSSGRAPMGSSPISRPRRPSFWPEPDATALLSSRADVLLNFARPNRAAPDGQYQQHGAVAVLTLSDPATLNAIAPDMVDELSEGFARASREARCVVLTGEGRGFSSGANLTSAGPAPTDADGRVDVGKRLQEHYN